MVLYARFLCLVIPASVVESWRRTGRQLSVFRFHLILLGKAKLSQQHLLEGKPTVPVLVYL